MLVEGIVSVVLGVVSNHPEDLEFCNLTDFLQVFKLISGFVA